MGRVFVFRSVRGLIERDKEEGKESLLREEWRDGGWRARERGKRDEG